MRMIAQMKQVFMGNLVIGCNSGIDKLEVGWALAQHDANDDYFVTFLLGQGPTYGILFVPLIVGINFAVK